MTVNSLLGAARALVKDADTSEDEPAVSMVLTELVEALRVATELAPGPIYGIAEIAQALGQRPQTVAVWYGRGKLPEPTQRLKATPVWAGPQIEEWLRQAPRKT